VSNHVVDLVSRYKPEELPPELTSYISDRKEYNYLHHAEVGSSNAEFVTDEVVDRFCIVGNAAEHTRKLQVLRSHGVTQFNILFDVRRRRENAGDLRARHHSQLFLGEIRVRQLPPSVGRPRHLLSGCEMF